MSDANVFRTIFIVVMIVFVPLLSLAVMLVFKLASKIRQATERLNDLKTGSRMRSYIYQTGKGTLQ